MKHLLAAISFMGFFVGPVFAGDRQTPSPTDLVRFTQDSQDESAQSGDCVPSQELIFAQSSLEEQVDFLLPKLDLMRFLPLEAGQKFALLRDDDEQGKMFDEIAVYVRIFVQQDQDFFRNMSSGVLFDWFERGSHGKSGLYYNFALISSVMSACEERLALEKNKQFPDVIYDAA